MNLDKLVESVYNKLNTIEHCEFCGKSFGIMKITCMDCQQIGCNDCVRPLANARCYPCYLESAN